MKPTVYVKSSATLLLTALLLLAFTTIPAYSQEASEGRYKLTHSLRVTAHGFIAVDDTVEVMSGGNSPLNLQPFEINYLSIPVTAISSVTVNGSVDFDVEKSGVSGVAKLTVKPRSAYPVQSGSSTAVRIQFYISNLVTAADSSSFTATLPLLPTMNRVIEEVRSTVQFPADSDVKDIPPGFNLNATAAKKMDGVFQNVDSGRMYTQMVQYSVDAAKSLPLLDFPSVNRVFVVSVDGSVKVRDEILVASRGVGKASKVELTLLNEAVTSVDVVPIGTPPLANRFTTTLDGKLFDMVGAYHTSLIKGEQLLIGVEYPLSPRYSRSADGAVSLQIPVKPPVDGVVDQLTYRVEYASGLRVSGGESVRYEVATPYTTNLYGFTANLLVTWASGGVMLAATVIFAAALLFSLSRRVQPGKVEKVERETRGVEDVFTVFDEKLGLVDSVFQSFRSRRQRDVSRSGFSEARGQFEASRGRVAGKLGESRSKIVSLKPHLKERLEELSNMDKEYNRVVFDILNLYEQYHTGQIRSETFEKLVGKHEQRLRKAKEELREDLDYLHEEVEK